MERSELFDKVVEVVSDVLGISPDEVTEQTTFDEVLAAIRARDHNDMTRAASPLVKAVDAEEIDTTGMSIDQVTDYICDQVCGR